MSAPPHPTPSPQAAPAAAAAAVAQLDPPRPRPGVAPSGAAQLRALLRARARRLSSQALRSGPARLAGALAVVLGLPALMTGLGLAAAGPLERAAARPAAPGEVVTAGGVYADLGFWITAAMVAVFSFRIMEGLYRKQDVRVLAQYPIGLGVNFVYRTLSSLLEVAAVVVLAGFFMSPIASLTGDPRALMAYGLIAAGGWVTVTLGIAVQLVAGIADFGPSPARRRNAKDPGDESLAGKLGRMDAGGGFPAAFYMSPAIGLVASLVVVFLLKLAVVDELFAHGASRLFWTGLVSSGLVTLVALAVGHRTFTRHYPYLLARFYEADLIQLDTGYNYHTSITTGPRGLFERLVPARVLPHARKDLLQFGRRYPLLRGLHVAAWVGLGVALYNDAVSGPLVVALPALYLNLLVAPWSRLYGDELEPGVLAGLPVKPAGVWLAKLMTASRESLIVALPAAALIAALTAPAPTGAAYAAVALLAALGPVPLLTVLAARASAPLAWASGVLLALGAGVLAVAVSPWAALATLALGALGVLALPRHARARPSAPPAASPSP